MTELEKIAEKATAIIFLNAQWIASLANTLKDHDLYSETTHQQLVEHARNENQQVFNYINELRRKASADTIPRAEVAAAIVTLEAALRPNLFRTPEFYEAAMQIIEATRDNLALRRERRERMDNPTREQKCAELARAMGWQGVEIGMDHVHYSGHLPGERRDVARSYVPDYFTEACASRELIEWIAADDVRWSRFCFEFRINASVPAILMDYQDFDGELIPNIASLAKRLMTANLSVIAEAAWVSVVAEEI